MVKKEKRINSSENMTNILEDEIQSLTEKGEVISTSTKESDRDTSLIAQEDNINTSELDLIAELRQKVAGVFDYYPAEQSLFVTQDGNAFLAKDFSLSQDYVRKTKQKLFKITR